MIKLFFSVAFFIAFVVMIADHIKSGADERSDKDDYRRNL